MEPPPLLISWVNPFPSRFINRTIFFCNALESHGCACCLLSFLYFISSFLYQGAKLPQGIVLFITLLGKGLTPRACMGDAGSKWWVPVHANSRIKMTSMREVSEWGKGINILCFAEHHIDRCYEAATCSYKMKIK